MQGDVTTISTTNNAIIILITALFLIEPEKYIYTSLRNQYNTQRTNKKKTTKY